jgi:hypothetical protein
MVVYRYEDEDEEVNDGLDLIKDHSSWNSGPHPKPMLVVEQNCFSEIVVNLLKWTNRNLFLFPDRAPPTPHRYVVPLSLLL